MSKIRDVNKLGTSQSDQDKIGKNASYYEQKLGV